MEVIVEIPQDIAKELHLDSHKLSYWELRKKIAASEAIKHLQKAAEAARDYGIDNWTMDDINSLISEANAEYANNKTSS